MRREDSRTIDEIIFTCQQFAARESFKLLADLAKALGPAFGALEAASLSSMELSQLAPLFTSLDSNEMMRLVERILAGSHATVNNEITLLDPKGIDAVFTGDLMTMFKAVGFSLEVNYGDFFDVLGVAVKGMSPKTPSRSNLPTK